jgi:deferrochelatase/peroxidase EfeB
MIDDPGPLQGPTSSPGDQDRAGSAMSRRGFLRAGAAAAAGTAAGAAGSALSGGKAAAWAETPFHGYHQSSVLAPSSHAALFVSFDVIASGRSDMVDLLHTLTDRTRLLMAGGVPPFAGPAAPPSDNGILGPVVPKRQTPASGSATPSLRC